MYLLRASPKSLDGTQTNPLGPFTADNAGGSYSLWAIPTGQTDQYTLVGRGVFGRSTQTCTVLAQATTTKAGTIGQAVLYGGGTIVPGSLTINGPVQVNGPLVNFGTINGPVNATDFVWDFGHISPAPRTMPPRSSCRRSIRRNTRTTRSAASPGRRRSSPIPHWAKATPSPTVTR